MLKKIVFVPIALAMAIVILQCVNKPKDAPVQKAVIENPALMTHKEAADTMLIDSTAPLKPLRFMRLNQEQMLSVLKISPLDSLFVWDSKYPDNGFYGEDRYRIEFYFTEVSQDAADPRVYHIKGKNRHKKVITPFEGTFTLTDMSTFIDQNVSLDTSGETTMYATNGVFELAEDKNSKYSGLFKGTIKMEFSVFRDKDGIQKPQLWFYSEKDLPSEGAGYRFDGTWTSYKDAKMVKPVIWANDIFRFANDILTEFSVGEREVEINQKYHKLGWADFWGNDEWWQDAKKPTM
jgi:hypothetical protein